MPVSERDYMTNWHRRVGKPRQSRWRSVAVSVAGLVLIAMAWRLSLLLGLILLLGVVGMAFGRRCR